MKTPTENRDDTKIATICAAVLGVTLTVFGLGFFGGRTGFSVAIGAAIGVANLAAMRAIIRALVDTDTKEEAEAGEPVEIVEGMEPSEVKASDKPSKEARKRYGAAWGVFAVLKMFILFGGIWLLLSKHVVDAIPLVVGYGVLPFGIVMSALLSTLSMSKKDASKKGEP